MPSRSLNSSRKDKLHNSTRSNSKRMKDEWENVRRRKKREKEMGRVIEKWEG